MPSFSTSSAALESLLSIPAVLTRYLSVIEDHNSLRAGARSDTPAFVSDTAAIVANVPNTTATSDLAGDIKSTHLNSIDILPEEEHHLYVLFALDYSLGTTH